MGALLISAAAAVVVFIAVLLLSPGGRSGESSRKKAMLDQMSKDADSANQRNFDAAIAKQRILLQSTTVSGPLAKIPGLQANYDLLLKAGLGHKVTVVLLCILLLFLISLLLLKKFGIIGFFIALAITYFVPRWYLKRRVNKRSLRFLNQFPDAIDMIVRSVRSGHPLNTALRMIAENMEEPVNDEFRQVVDEVSYGRSLPEALRRMAQRIDEPDLNFFVVVLSVQQETGGSLAEVLTNLSSIIRKRRQLRLKIRALTSEGRATSYVLGALPLIVFSGIYFTSPKYLDPLFNTFIGYCIAGSAAGLIVLAMWIVNNMVNNIDI